MLTPPAGYSASQKTPAMVIGISFASGGRSGGTAGMRLLLLGMKTAEGTADLDKPVDCASPDDADILCGYRSQLARMARKVFDQWRRPILTLCPVTDGAGVAATATLLFATVATASGTFALTICGETIYVNITTGDTAIAIATAVVAAVTAQTRWPVTAANGGTATVTITQANKGTGGNDAKIRFKFSAALGTTCAMNGYAASGVSGSGHFGDTTNAGPVAGTNTENITNALAACAAQKYDHIAIATVDTANWTRLVTHVNTYAGVNDRRRQRGIWPAVKALADAITDGNTQNAHLGQAAWHYNSEQPAGEVAAQVAAARLWGDSQVGGGIGKSKGEATYRAANLDGTLLASITEQPDPNDVPLGTEIESALNSGLTPLVPSPAHPGFVMIARSITNRWKDAAGNPSYTIIDTSKPEVLHYAADRFESVVVAAFPNKNLVPEPTNGRLPEHEDSVCPSMIRSVLLADAYEQEREGFCVNVDAHKDEFRVEISPDNDSLALAYIPYAVIKHFHNFAGTLADVG